MIWRFILIIFLSFGIGEMDAAERNELEAIEREIETRRTRARALSRETQELAKSIKKLKNQIITHAKELRRIDGERDRLEARLVELNTSAEQLSVELLKDRRNLSQTLAALQIMEQHPPPAFIIHPNDALRAVQSAIALAGIVPIMQSKAYDLQAQLLELSAIRRRIAERETALHTADNDARTIRAKLDKSLAAKAHAERAARTATRAEEQKIAKLVREARNLKELLAKLAEQERKRATKNPSRPSILRQSFAHARGKLALPVSGEITENYGIRQNNGQTTRGITITARAGAQITAPYDARVLYAGTFRQYGSIVILGIDSGYQILLAGLGKSQSYAGQVVLAGEPVGTMPDAQNSPSYSRQALYLELRHKGQPIDPTPWIAYKGKG